MRFGISVAATVAALASFEYLAAKTPAATIQVAQAQDLSSSLQFKVKKLATTINKSRKSLASQSAALAADTFKAKQFAQRIDNFANSLTKYPANTDPAFIAAKAELAALQQEFSALKGGAAAPAPAATTETPAAAPIKPSGLDSSAKIKLTGLIGNMDRTRKLLLTNGVQTLQTTEGVEKLKKTLGEYTATLGIYKAHQSDPAVQNAIRSYQALVATAQETFAKAKGAKAGNDDIQAELAALKEALNSNTPPKVLFIPFNEDEAVKWVTRTKEVKATGERVMLALNEIGSKHALPIGQTKFDKQDVQSMYMHAQTQIRRTNEAIEESERNFASAFDFQHDLDYHRKRDPENAQHVAMMLQEGSEVRTYEQLDRLLRESQSHAFYEKAKTGTISAEKQSRIDEVIALRKTYSEMRTKLIGDSKLPEPKSTDEKRLKIAKAILDTPKYEFGEYGPIVLVSENIDTKSKTVTRREIKDVDVSLSGDITWSGTEESWNYDWDEYTFATPLKDESGDWYIWWIKPTFYRSGASTTPLNKWISGSATKGSLILEKNFR